MLRLFDALSVIHQARVKAFGPANEEGEMPRGWMTYHNQLGVLKILGNYWAAHCGRPRPWPLSIKVLSSDERPLPIQATGTDAQHLIVRSLRSIDSYAARCCEFLLFSGWRMNEARKLEAEEVIGGCVTQKIKTRVRSVPLNRQCLALVAGKTGRAFLCTEDQLRTPMERVCKALGVHLCIHDLRKIFVSVAIGRVRMDRVLKNILVGHTQEKLDATYASSQPLEVILATSQAVADHLDSVR